MTLSAPARVDLAGGTLDVPPLCFFFDHVITINLAVNLRVKVRLEKGEGRILVQGQDPVLIESVNLYRLALQYFSRYADRLQGSSIDFHVSSRIPRASGLGGSSSLLSAVVSSLENSLDLGWSLEKRLDSVTVLEHRLLGKPAGSQDAIAAIYGGLSRIDFESGRPVRTALALPDFLKGPLHLIYSSRQHHSGLNNWSIIAAACDGDRETLSALEQLNLNAHAMLAALEEQDRDLFRECLQREASLRFLLSAGILAPEHRAFAEHFQRDLICKACGAGGGGAMLAFGDVDPSDMRRVAAEQDLEVIDVYPDLKGCI